MLIDIEKMRVLVSGKREGQSAAAEADTVRSEALADDAVETTEGLFYGVCIPLTLAVPLTRFNAWSLYFDMAPEEKTKTRRKKMMKKTGRFEKLKTTQNEDRQFLSPVIHPRLESKRQRTMGAKREGWLANRGAVRKTRDSGAKGKK